VTDKSSHLSGVSLFELRNRINKLKSADLGKLSPGQLRHRVGRIIDQYPLQLRPLEFSGVYRARKNLPGREFQNAKELWYPPASLITKPGRLNGIGQARLYASSMPNTTMYELKPEVGDTFTILIARTKSGKPELIRNLAFIGIERSLAPEVQNLSAHDLFRTSPSFRQSLGETGYKKWLLIDDFLSGILGERIEENEDIKYKLTAAFGDLVFEFPKIDAICYPSVATRDHGINICFSSARADELLTPSEAWLITIDGLDSHSDFGGTPLPRIKFVKRSEAIASDGALKWLPPGVGLHPEEINRFVRRRIKTLATPPRPA
jgi:hypothetical protein